MGSPYRTDVCPTASGLAEGGGKVWFMNNSYLQSYNPATGGMCFEAPGFAGDILVYEGAPWAISVGGGVQTFVNGNIVSVNLGWHGFQNSAASDGAGHIYIACEGYGAWQGDGVAQGANLLRLDVNTHEVRSYPFRPWTQADDDRSTANPYSSVVVDAKNQRAYVYSYYHHDITSIHLDNGTIERFTDPRILKPSILALDGQGGVVFFQSEGFMRMASNGTFTSSPWPTGFSPSYNGGYWMSGITVDVQGRAWVVGDGSKLVCMPPTGPGSLYNLDNPGWVYGGWLLWDQGRLWLVNNGNTNSTVGNLLEIQVPSNGSTSAPTPPVLSARPSSVQVGQYQSCTFSLVATGNGILTYQWCHNGAAIPWAIESQYTVPKTTGAEEGRYTCTIVNHLFGKTSAITTDPVSLSVVQEPSIPAFSAEPRFVRSGQPVALTAHFSGGTGVINPGGIPVVSGVPVIVDPSEPTTYQLIVTNVLGRVATASLTVSVDSPTGLLLEFSASPTMVPFGQSTTLAWATDPSVTDLKLHDDLGFVGPLDVYGFASNTLIPVRRQRFSLTAKAAGTQGILSVQTAARGLDRIAGHPGGLGQLDGRGTDALLSYPGALAVRPDGTLIFADSSDPVIRQIAPDGTVTTLSGCYGQSGDQDGPAAHARYTQISGLALAADGTLFILDHGAGKLKKLTAAGHVETVATIGGGGSGMFVEQMCFDTHGNLLVPLHLENRVVAVSPQGAITQVVAGITYPRAVAALPDGRVIVLSGFDGSLTVIGSDGELTSVLPSIAQNDPIGPHAGWVTGLSADNFGDLYVSTGKGVFLADTDFVLHSIRATDGSAAATGFFGNIAATPQGYQWAYRTGMGAEMLRINPGQGAVRVAGQIRPFTWQGETPVKEVFNMPCGITQGPEGNLFVADADLALIRRISPSGVIEDLSLGTSAGWGYWSGLWSDASGRIVFPSVKALWQFDPKNGTLIDLVSGGWFYEELRDGAYGYATVGDVRGLVGDSSGNIYFLDSLSEGDCRISVLLVRKLRADGSVVTLAGGGYGFVDGYGASARFASPRDIALDPAGNLIVVDQGNHAIRKVTPDGVVSTIAGGSGQGFQDGLAAQAKFNWPSGVAVDAQGNIFVTDTYNAALRVITPDGMVSTLIGNPAQPGARIGPIGCANLFRPQDVQVNADGDLLITDSGMVLQLTAPMQR
jgi:sugar lactone lactonase YvrE